MIAEPPIEITEQEAKVKPSRRKRAPERTHKSLVVHHGRNRHQRRSQASTARTQASRDARSELKLEMNRVHRNRRNRSFKINRGGQFRRRGAA